MNNFEKLKSMSVEELAKRLDQNGMWDNSPWSKWFDSQYCRQCKSVEVYVPDWDRECDFAWCELEHMCRYFQELPKEPSTKDIIKLWLEAEVKE